MSPAFHEGDRVLVWRWGRVREGDVVVLRRGGLTMLKRATHKVGEQWHVRGDNLAGSTDSVEFGEVAADQILGRVLMKY